MVTSTAASSVKSKRATSPSTRSDSFDSKDRMHSHDIIPMGIREKLSENKNLGLAAGIGLVVIAALIVARTFWPTRQADLNQAFYSDDDGKTWFTDSTFRVAPFDHNGKTAVVA